ncbi:hypothetical protein DRO60_03825 [Candidatus Bathyarchaeota archaeon]|nr:MAG: hypothetical protein DRO60_03825 [Candidatus Bathyarchaeota archaeon]
MAQGEVTLDLQTALRAAEHMLGGLGWPRLGILSFKDEVLVSAKGKAITPELLLLALGLKAGEEGLRALVLLNARKEHALSLLGQEGFASLSRLLEPLGLKLIYFGPSSEGPLASLERARLPFEWLALNAVLLAKLAEAATPVRRKAKEVDVSDLPALSRFLVETLGPPSFKEDVLARIKGANKYEVAADAISTAAAVISPTSLIGTGLKYAAKFFSLVRQRRKEEYRAYLEQWRRNVEAAFSEEVLARLVGEDGLGPVKEALEARELAVLVQDAIGTPHELFLPLLIACLADELAGEGYLLALDGASHLARLDVPVELLPSLPEKHPGLRLACFLPTSGLSYERLPELVRALTAERAAIFDLDPALESVLYEGRSAAFRAALLRCLELAAKERLAGRMAFVLYDTATAPMPELVVVKAGLLSRLKAKLGRLRRRGT